VIIVKVYGVIRGMYYLHCEGQPYNIDNKPEPRVKYRLCHGDLKPDNILVGGDKESPIAWIGDFDFAGVLGRGGTLSTRGSQTRYTAPELLFGSPERETRRYLLEKGDIFSLGLTVYTMLTGKLPFAEFDGFFKLQTFQVESIENATYFAEHCPQKDEMGDMGDMYDVISPCWTFEADRRPTMESIERNYQERKKNKNS